MKKSIRIFFLWMSVAPAVFAQTGEHAGGGRFLKRTEYNFLNNTKIIEGKEYGICNLDSKTDVEKLFFGDFNAQMEFFVSPSFEGASGFRIIKDTTDGSYILEVNHISNYKQAVEQAEEKFRTIGIPGELYFSIPKEIKDLTRDHNMTMYPKQQAERLKLYQVETLSFPISNRFAEKLYTKTVSSIDNFRAKGKPAGIFDGTTVTFRCIVDDEVWTLTIHEPKGDIRIFSDLCRQIITDAEADKLEESEYIKILKK